MPQTISHQMVILEENIFLADMVQATTDMLLLAVSASFFKQIKTHYVNECNIYGKPIQNL